MLWPVLAFSQEHYKTIDLQELQAKEKILSAAGDSMVRGLQDSTRMHACLLFNESMTSLLAYQNTFDYGFDSLKNVSILKSDDGKVKIYTWVLQSSDRNAYSYYGFVQVFDKKTKQVKLYRLQERPFENAEAMSKTCKPEEWYGAYYYRMIEKKISGNNTYTLLGWHGNNRLTTKKVIDILMVSPDGITFGAPVFKGEGKPKYRVVFEFTSQAVMKLAFEEKKKMIVFDRLSPVSGAQKGQYEFYGPDFRYDGYKFKKGYWLLQKDLDLRNPKSTDQKEGKKEPGKKLYVPGGE